MKKAYVLLPYIAFIICLIIAFRNMICSYGFIGHTWDWGLPHFAGQYIENIKHNFYIWDDTTVCGKYLYFRFELLYWLIIFPFSFFGGTAASKLILLTFLFVSAISMYRLARFYKLKVFWSTAAGIFYMFSPAAYSKIITGHLTILFGYSLLPFLVLYLEKVLDKIKNDKKVYFRDIFYVAVLFSLQMIHSMMLIISLIIVSILIIWRLILGTKRFRTIAVTAAIFTLIILINSFWFFPALCDYWINKTISHTSGLSIAKGEKFAQEEELPMRRSYIKTTSQPVVNSARIYSRTGMDTEYIWPIPDKIEIYWLIVSFLILLLFFLNLFIRSLNVMHFVMPYIITAILGIYFVSGYNTLLGAVIFEGLAKLAPVVYMDISHTPRFFIIICFSYTIGFFSIMDAFEKFYKNKVFPSIIRSTGLLCLIIYLWPFLNGNITKPIYENITQPFSLKINKINPEDKLVYNYFKNKPDDFRITYLPPVEIAWPGETDLSYEWNINSGLSPKPEFLENPDKSALGYDIVQSLFSLSPTPYISKLFGIANVKYIIYPHYNYFVSFRDFIEGYSPKISVEGFKDYKPILDESLKKQEGLKEVETGFKTVTIYENEFFVPHIYVSNNNSIIFGNRESFVPLSTTDCFSGKPASIFIESENDLKKLESETGKIIDPVFAVLTNNSCTKNIFVPEDSDYKLQVKMHEDIREVYKLNSMYDLHVFEKEEIEKWEISPNKCTYNYKEIDGNTLAFACVFDGNAEEDEFVQLKRKGLNIDLEEYPDIEMFYKVDDCKVQTVEVIAGLDFNADGASDEYIRLGYPTSSSENYDVFRVNVYEMAKRAFPDRLDYKIAEIELYLHKLWGFDCSAVLNKGEYLFWPIDVRFVDYIKERRVKIYKDFSNNKYFEGEKEIGKWKVIEKDDTGYGFKRLGRWFALAKGNHYLEFSRRFAKPVDISKWQYLKFNYSALPFTVNRVSLSADLTKRRNVYIADLYVNNDFNKFDMNIYEILKIRCPDLSAFSLRRIKFKIDEKETVHKEYKTEKHFLDEDYILCIKHMGFYSLEIPEDIEINNPVVSVDGNNLCFKRKLSKKDREGDIYCSWDIRLSKGWHTINWNLVEGEIFNLNWAVLSPQGINKNTGKYPKADFIKISPVRYILNININHFNEPFWLVFLENYHEGWKAYLYNDEQELPYSGIKGVKFSTIKWPLLLDIIKGRDRRIGLTKHFIVNGYANGWWIDKDKLNGRDNLSISIEFRPQRYYELGILAAGSVLFIGFFLVLIEYFKVKIK